MAEEGVGRSMVVVREKGKFLGESYQLETEYKGELNKEESSFLDRMMEWNHDADRFSPEKVYGIFDEMRRLKVEKEGNLRNRFCYWCRGVTCCFENGRRIVYRMIGVPDNVTARITVIYDNRAAVYINRQWHYVFMEEQIAAGWRSLKPHDIADSDWPKEFDMLLQKQIFSREKLIDSFYAQKIPIYTIRPGYLEVGPLIKPCFYGIALNGVDDPVLLTKADYQNLDRVGRKECIATAERKIYITNYECNEKYFNKVEDQTILNSAEKLEALKNDLEYPIGKEGKWMKQVFLLESREDRMAMVWQCTMDSERLIILTDAAYKVEWKRQFPEAIVETVESLIWDFNDCTCKLSLRPIVFVWDSGHTETDGLGYLQFLLRFCPVSREILFLSKNHLEWESKSAQMEEILNISDLTEAIKNARSEAQKCPDKGCELLRCANERVIENVVRKAIGRGEHILWVLNHLDLYKIPQEYLECSTKVRDSTISKDIAKDTQDKWYRHFLAKYQNNAFMFRNSLQPQNLITSSALDAYFVPVEDDMVPLGFLQTVDMRWRVRQRRRILQWVEQSLTEWRQYLYMNFIEFYSDKGELLRGSSERKISADFDLIVYLLFQKKNRKLEIDYQNMYIGMNHVLDVL